MQRLEESQNPQDIVEVIPPTSPLFIEELEGATFHTLADMRAYQEWMDNWATETAARRALEMVNHDPEISYPWLTLWR